MTIQENIGDIQINNEVVARIASMAAAEVDGIVHLGGKISQAEAWARKKDIDKGFSVETSENKAFIKAEVNVEYGVDIYKAAHQLQQTIKNAVEGLTGLNVARVDVMIKGIVLGENPRRPTVESTDIRSVAGDE